MPKLSQSPLILAGRSNQKYSFGVYSMDTSFSKTGGIYVFTVRTSSGNGNYSHDVVYIGKTNDLSTRFYDHHKISCIQKNKANAIGVIPVGTESERTKIEEDLLGNYNTKCNIQLN